MLIEALPSRMPPSRNATLPVIGEAEDVTVDVSEIGVPFTALMAEELRVVLVGTVPGVGVGVGPKLLPPPPPPQLTIKTTSATQVAVALAKRSLRFLPDRPNKHIHASPVAPVIHQKGIPVFPAVAGAEVEMVRTAVTGEPVSGNEEGRNEQLAPTGKPAPQLRVTVVFKPGTGVTVTFTLADCPAATVRAEAPGDTWKFGGATVTVIGLEVAEA